MLASRNIVHVVTDGEKEMGEPSNASHPSRAAWSRSFSTARGASSAKRAKPSKFPRYRFGKSASL
jgi:hypothetical protein